MQLVPFPNTIRGLSTEEVDRLAEAQGRVRDAAEVVQDQEPPDAEALGIASKVRSLPPARARLCRFQAWIASLKAELEQAEAGRARFLQQMEVPAVTDASLQALVAEDKQGFVKWLLRGGSVTRQHTREFEHQFLQAKLKVNTYDAQIARDGLPEVEFRIDVLHHQIEILEERHEQFVHTALIEHAQAAAQKYQAAIAALEDAIAPLLGLASVAGGARPLTSRDAFYFTYAGDLSFKAQVPRFNFGSDPEAKGPPPPYPAVNVPLARIADGAVPWRNLAQMWRVDPYATPKGQR
jgi:hypothetical protein